MITIELITLEEFVRSGRPTNMGQKDKKLNVDKQSTLMAQNNIQVLTGKWQWWHKIFSLPPSYTHLSKLEETPEDHYYTIVNFIATLLIFLRTLLLQLSQYFLILKTNQKSYKWTCNKNTAVLFSTCALHVDQKINLHSPISCTRWSLSTNTPVGKLRRQSAAAGRRFGQWIASR